MSFRNRVYQDPTTVIPAFAGMTVNMTTRPNEPATDILQGRNAVLNLDLRWELGRLGRYVPEIGRYIATLADKRARANQAEARSREIEATLRQLRNR